MHSGFWAYGARFGAVPGSSHLQIALGWLQAILAARPWRSRTAQALNVRLMQRVEGASA